MGSGTDEWAEWATPLGVLIAKRHHDLLTGAGGGVMTAVARAFCSVPGRRGRSIGIVPTQPDGASGFVPLPGYPNLFIDLPILTPLPRKASHTSADTLTRNHVNILSSDVVIVLPGNTGTRDEIGLCLRFGKPLLGFCEPAAFGAGMPGLMTTTALAEVANFMSTYLGPSDGEGRAGESSSTR
jgi:predicted Rossmann-fold nucleotide-binding protein